jgi:hypothetical protein
MKRSAADAFGGSAATASTAAPTAAFQPAGAAMFDPKAYFAQMMSHAQMAPPASAGAATPAGAATSKPDGANVEAWRAGKIPFEKLDLQVQVVEASAVRLAQVLKEKGNNFTTALAIDALGTMATKSSYKLREELYKQPHVKRLCQRIQDLIKKPPMGLSLEDLVRATWSLAQFPEEAAGDKKQTFMAVARTVGNTPPSAYNVNDAAKVLVVLAKQDVIIDHKPLVSKFVAELVRDQGRRVAQLTHENLVQILHAVAQVRRHLKEGDLQTVHVEPNDEELFKYVAARVSKELEQIQVRLIAELIHTHNECGIRNEDLFLLCASKIIANQKELNEKAMGKVIKAYTRYMIPLREEQQGFRTMAIVAKGDFIRPSEKPKRGSRKNAFDKPIALYEKTQVHSRG